MARELPSGGGSAVASRAAWFPDDGFAHACSAPRSWHFGPEEGLQDLQYLADLSPTDEMPGRLHLKVLSLGPCANRGRASQAGRRPKSHGTENLVVMLAPRPTGTVVLQGHPSLATPDWPALRIPARATSTASSQA